MCWWGSRQQSRGFWQAGRQATSPQSRASRVPPLPRPTLQHCALFRAQAAQQSAVTVAVHQLWLCATRPPTPARGLSQWHCAPPPLLPLAPAGRLPNLVALLVTAPPTGPAPLVPRLQDGFAACLQASLFSLGVAVAVEGRGPGEEGAAVGGGGGADGGGGEEEGDPRAALVLHLLLAALEQPLPNLAHLLCGYDAESGGWWGWQPALASVPSCLLSLLASCMV